MSNPPTYDGRPIPEPTVKLTSAQQFQLLNTHPLFTGWCPKCETPIPPGKKDWRCAECGWSSQEES